MVDAIVPGAVFALPDECVCRFPAQYPFPGEVFAPVWEGSKQSVPCVVVTAPGVPMGPPRECERVLLFHGNGETMEGARPLAMKLAELCKAYVFIVEYPGYWCPDEGEPGPRSAAGTYSNASLAAQLLAKYVAPTHLVGYSLGTTLAVRVAKEMGTPFVQSLTLIAPFCSAMGVAATSPAVGIPAGMRPFIALMKPLFSGYDVFCADRDAPYVKGVRSAVVYGDRDKVVSNSQGARMAKLLGAKELVVEGQNHTTIVMHDEAIGFMVHNITGREIAPPAKAEDAWCPYKTGRFLI